MGVYSLKPWLCPPEAIIKRLKLNLSGLNGLSTHIFRPDFRPSRDDLGLVLQLSNKINQDLGLPDSKDLIIRSRRIRPTGEVMQKFLSSALLIIDADGDNPLLKSLERGDGKKTFNEIEDFFQTLPPDTWLMVHDDNEETQREAVHGCFMQRTNPLLTELMLGTGMLHARELNRELDEKGQVVGKPFIHLKGKSEAIFHLPEYVRSNGRELFYYAQELRETILTSYETVTKIFGDGTTMEFRYYRSRAQNNFHILDVMTTV